MPSIRGKSETNKSKTPGNYNIRASDEIQRVTRWEKIVNNKLGRAKMAQFLDQANLRGDLDELKDLD